MKGKKITKSAESEKMTYDGDPFFEVMIDRDSESSVEVLSAKCPHCKSVAPSVSEVCDDLFEAVRAAEDGELEFIGTRDVWLDQRCSWTNLVVLLRCEDGEQDAEIAR